MRYSFWPSRWPRAVEDALERPLDRRLAMSLNYASQDLKWAA